MDTQRVEQIRTVFAQQGLHAIVCRMPEHVLMFTGYQPILGNTFCIVSLDHAQNVEVRLALPEEEQDLVPPGAAVEKKTFSEETLSFIGNTLDVAREPLGALLQAASLPEYAVVGFESANAPIASAYTQVGIPGPGTYELLHSLLLEGQLRDATAELDSLAAVKTEVELAAIRQAEKVALQGFLAARAAVRVGGTEAAVAAATTAALLRAGYAMPGVNHVQAYVHVMAGARAALAFRAFNLTTNTLIERGDCVNVQMEIALNGYWVELTRTFFAGAISDEWRAAYQACIAAQQAALPLIRAGVAARSVDEAARRVMQQAGFGPAFKHGLGHGFGFQAINHSAAPILHPVSGDILQAGMVHNMEPAVYLEGKGGFRLNDDVAVHHDGGELLSAAIPRELSWLVVEEP